MAFLPNRRIYLIGPGFVVEEEFKCREMEDQQKQRINGKIKFEIYNFLNNLLFCQPASVKAMLALKLNKNNEKQKRLSESKACPAYEYKLPSHLNSYYSHNRSTSVDKSKKLRLLTDYDEYETQHSQDKNYRKTGNSKKQKGMDYLSNKYSAYEVGGVQSTKNNPKKNMEVKLLFNRTKNNQQQKAKNKIQTSHHHPLFKYMNNKNRDNRSPYSKDAPKLQSKFKKSTSKNKRQPSQNKNPSINLKKNQIKISTSKDLGRKNEQQQQTVKTIKKKVNDEPSHTLSRLEDQGDSSYSDGFGLTEEEEQTFGDRFPYGFEKVKLLGRGGFSLVWLGKHIKSGKHFAIKQIITQNTHQTHIKEIWFGTNFFTLGGVPKPEFSGYDGVKNLVRMYSYQINQTDTWIFYEKCGNSLGSNLYDIRSQKVFGNEKLYKIFYKPFYKEMSSNSKILKTLIVEICKSLLLLSECQIVHSDLKTQNILIKYQQTNQMKVTQVKLIDYGSSFEFKHISQFSMATPEYMPPQILNYIIHENEGQYEEPLYEEVMSNYRNPWVVDIFSLGCVVLEIIVGVPLWMSLPLLVPNKIGSSYCQKEGLFAVKGRLFPQIIKKQRKVVEKLDYIIENENYSRIAVSTGMRKALKGMLAIDFNERISPHEVIKILEKEGI